MRLPPVDYQHLVRLSDGVGLFEHARYTLIRREHGYCVDDVARGLVVLARAEDLDDQLLALGELYLQFVVDAQAGDGRFRNRRHVDGRWTDGPTVEDCWGRALWGLGAAAARVPEWTDQALLHFTSGADRRSPDVRAMAFGALGAAEVLARWPQHPGARALLADTATMIGRPAPDALWPWPETRLRYANAVLPEVLMAAGRHLDSAQATADGLRLLEWLWSVETAGGRVSVTPVGGWAPGEPRPGFDQQPIEVAALADACARAFDLTADDRWRDAVVRCGAWFGGDNDAGVSLMDLASGGGHDGLHRIGRNENEGAESTLALISTLQQVHRMPVLSR